jgi:xanthine dehydrogenase accessory factor
MESIYDELARLSEAGETAAVATIIDVRGSVPREVGAKMIIHPLGRHVGTVGGGCGEADVIKAGLDVMQSDDPAVVRVDLTEDITMQALGVCGGIMDVFVKRAVSSDSPRLYGAMRASVAQREPVALVTVVRGPTAGREAVVWLHREPEGCLELGSWKHESWVTLARCWRADSIAC